MKVLDLSGEWAYKTDYDDNGITREYYKEKFDQSGFILPGSTCDNKIGKKHEYYN